MLSGASERSDEPVPAQVDRCPVAPKMRGMVLLHKWGPAKHYKNLPSWVPDWSTTSTQPGSQVVNEYIAGHPIKVNANITGLRTLKISSQRIDWLASTDQTPHGFQDDATDPVAVDACPKDREQAIVFLNTLEALIAPVLADGGDIDRAVYDISIAMSTTDLYKARPNDCVIYDSYCALRGVDRPSGSYHSQTQEQDAGHTYLGILRSSHARRIFVTKNGFVGVCDSAVQPGDGVFILQSFAGPWILRPLPGGSYRMIARAHLYNIEKVLGVEGQQERIVIA